MGGTAGTAVPAKRWLQEAADRKEAGLPEVGPAKKRRCEGAATAGIVPGAAAGRQLEQWLEELSDSDFEVLPKLRGRDGRAQCRAGGRRRQAP